MGGRDRREVVMSIRSKNGRKVYEAQICGQIEMSPSMPGEQPRGSRQGDLGVCPRSWMKGYAATEYNDDVQSYGECRKDDNSESLIGDQNLCGDGMASY